jgi:hypothetical protein
MAMTESGRSPVEWALRAGAVASIVRALTGRPFLDRLAAIAFIGMFLLIAAYTVVRPDYNWDMVAYVATALEPEAPDAATLHAETWREVEAAKPPAGRLYEIQQGNPYNLHQWQNPEDFQSQLSMYRVKMGYVWLLRALQPITGLINAAVLLNVLPLLVIGFVAFRWLREADAMQAALMLGPALILADLFHMATALTPDMLLAAVSLVAIYMLARGRDLAAGILLFASVLIRPDNVVFVFALLLTAILFGWRLMPMLVTFVASMVACVLVQKVNGHPGWWAHFYFSCVEIQNSMAGFRPDFSLAAFIQGYVRGVVVSIADNDWPAILVLLVCGWALLNKAGRIPAGRGNALLFAMVIGTLGKFASFPLPDDRLYFVTIGGMVMLMAVYWRPRFDNATPRAPQVQLKRSA